MGYGRTLLAKDTAEEKRKLEEKLKDKGLFGSIGSTLGTILASVFLGPGASILQKALITGAASGTGKAIGGAMAGKVPEGKFYQGERKDAKKMFVQDIFSNALQNAVTSGMMGGLQGADLTKGGTDFENSLWSKWKAPKNKYKELFGNSDVYDPGMIKSKNLNLPNPGVQTGKPGFTSSDGKSQTKQDFMDSSGISETALDRILKDPLFSVKKKY